MSIANIHNQRLFNITFLVISTVVLVITGWRSALVPFNHDETATFYYFIQSGEFLPFQSHVDANNHILNSFLGWISFKLFGDSLFSLRLPNLMGLVLLAVACWKITHYLTGTFSKLTLLACFLISFHWLSFYSACRGYGLSMSLLLFSLAFLMDYFKKGQLKNVVLFCLFLQLAISANLILIIVGIILIAVLAIYQFLEKKLFEKRNLLLLLVHLSCTFLWIKLSFFLKDSNALYYGHGESYWKVTFVSLIEVITGSKSMPVLLGVLTFFISVLVVSVLVNYKTTRRIQDFFSKPSLFFTLMLLILILAFYLLKVLLGVNYPEDRTGLFFYLFFVLSLIFTIDVLPSKMLKFIATPLILASIIHFSVNLNFRKHSLSTYETLPERFYEKLLQEQKGNPDRITIGAHRLREFTYAFLNYRNKGVLNLADPPESMHMNTDYAIALKTERPLYEKYYEEIDEDTDWGFTLLKRKEPIKRNLIFSNSDIKTIEGNGEYYEFYNSRDMSLTSRNPLLVEFNITCEGAEPLLNSWLVFSVDSAENQNATYKRIPLNWIKYDWNGSEDLIYHLVSGPLPENVHRVTCFLWNLDQQNIKLKLNEFKIYQLEADGVSFVAP